MFMVKVGVSQQYNIYSKTATFLGKAEKSYLGLAVAPATWYNIVELLLVQRRENCGNKFKRIRFFRIF